MAREYYSSLIQKFVASSVEEVLGELADNNQFSLELSQKNAWKEQIVLLQNMLAGYVGKVYFEYSIPRMGRRIDVLLLINGVIFVLEFKVGERAFHRHDIDQVWDYALDLKNFHETSHDLLIAPVLIATKAKQGPINILMTPHDDNLLFPILCNAQILPEVITGVLEFAEEQAMEPAAWEQGRYLPTPTIIEAAMSLYQGHSVEDISRKDADAINLDATTDAISAAINYARSSNQKCICFVTGVPGAGKTLVGLNIANKHMDKASELYSVFLSGNGPLVAILTEALARDRVKRSILEGEKIKKGEARSAVKALIQNVHHFRDDCLQSNVPPIEHVVLFDEAQRAWNMKQTTAFMRQKKGVPDFDMSEPEFLISCMDRHKDWAVIVCLVGGGQEINTGEAGISEWIEAINRSYPDWHVYISPQIHDSEYAAGEAVGMLRPHRDVTYIEHLHLAVSMRSYRAENVSALVKQILDLDVDSARQTLGSLQDKYPIVVTRCMKSAKSWLKQKARGSERYGIVVSSQASRLKPHAIDVKSPMNPVHWFLEGKDDVRSSYYLEDVATEFHIQGLELDWACVTWDADFRFSQEGWKHFSFRGNKWQRINKAERQMYLKNAYRVLLTRARQGMVIVVPQGDAEDPTRDSDFYDDTFDYLVSIGLQVIE
ncbi:DUF2075 domain-containing protein [Mariprofundus sp. EBB-1]|uniref:DUF2075 domain-containing protein n=1 Tax=Mariprofundus sp. EBB-1 TaxID=2650971 RepID=UPI000EF269C0|nr:DUF2075 domain-containing protein [Mariprofundus sp. EBB-1]RLL52253.1 DUF2075 domain-containing protein [Mariprofundus sp. EBB-1]